MKMKIIALLLSLFVMVPALTLPAFAADLATAKTQGMVGERPDGLVGSVNAVDAATQQMIDQVNAERMAKYKAIAEKNGTPIDQVQALAGAKLIGQTPSGQFIMNAAGQWQKK